MSKIFLSNNIQQESGKKGIVLQTTLGNEIDNWQIKEFSHVEINYGGTYYPEKFPLLKFKGRMTGIYNCHGFTFGSRRTNIPALEIRKILHEDNYILIKPGEEIMIGDVVLYVSNDGSADIPHTGMVVGVENNGGLETIFVLGKWGKYKEVVHPLLVCDYPDCSFEYWRNNHGYIAVV